jgi:hypothetical protein
MLTFIPKNTSLTQNTYQNTMNIQHRQRSSEPAQFFPAACVYGLPVYPETNDFMTSEAFGKPKVMES